MKEKWVYKMYLWSFNKSWHNFQIIYSVVSFQMILCYFCVWLQTISIFPIMLSDCINLKKASLQYTYVCEYEYIFMYDQFYFTQLPRALTLYVIIVCDFKITSRWLDKNCFRRCFHDHINCSDAVFLTYILKWILSKCHGKTISKFTQSLHSDSTSMIAFVPKLIKGKNYSKSNIASLLSINYFYEIPWRKVFYRNRLAKIIEKI